ncbi:EO2 protein [Japanese eel endothelial cells-infecting virus]|uniref:EO2 protein n=1 Tax=Japanese eel endothelial cells-infecting virus TaxID=712037 RepID=UPI00052E5D64|nr:EO2 protein [Japanese eel endothelial cells-infecting virus]
MMKGHVTMPRFFDVPYDHQMSLLHQYNRLVDELHYSMYNDAIEIRNMIDTYFVFVFDDMDDMQALLDMEFKVCARFRNVRIQRFDTPSPAFSGLPTPPPDHEDNNIDEEAADREVQDILGTNPTPPRPSTPTPPPLHPQYIQITPPMPDPMFGTPLASYPVMCPSYGDYTFQPCDCGLRADANKATLLFPDTPITRLVNVHYPGTTPTGPPPLLPPKRRLIPAQSPIIISDSPVVVADSSPVVIGDSPVVIGESPITIGESPVDYDALTLEDPFKYPARPLRCSTPVPQYSGRPVVPQASPAPPVGTSLSDTDTDTDDECSDPPITLYSEDGVRPLEPDSAPDCACGGACPGQCVPQRFDSPVPTGQSTPTPQMTWAPNPKRTRSRLRHTGGVPHDAHSQN